MLDSINLSNKSFEQLRDEMVAQIPLYSEDWTNYNISDPGITILENFAAFLALQQEELNEVPEKVREKLLGLAGFTVRRGRAASIYASLKRTGVKLPCALPARAKLYAQDICFEQAERRYVRDMEITDLEADAATDGGRAGLLLGWQGVRGGLALLGDKPAGGEHILFYVKNLPDAKEKTAIYFEMARPFPRNPLEAGGHNPFVTVKWEVKTAEGYSELEVCDETCGFLQSGYVSFALRKKLRRFAQKDGARDMYVLRLTVVRADYDIVPRFKKVRGLLMHLVQRDTLSDVVPICLSDRSENCISHFLLRGGYLELYGRMRGDEQEGKYRRYREGEQYRTEYVDPFTRRVIFEGPAPEELLAVCRAESVMSHRKLGVLYGYDNQSISLPESGRVYQGDFSVLVVEETEDGGALCHEVRPEAADRREVRYRVNEKENRLIVEDCGVYEGARLWLGEYAVYQGEGGNILAGARLLYGQQGEDVLLEFASCTEATDGRFEEDCAQLQRRFSQDVRKPVTMVTQRDCESIVQNIPGLSIHKIGVCPVPGRNEIRIAVKPNSSLPQPKLSEIYREEIAGYLEQYRMLTTKIVIEQPVYVPINVTGVIYVKKYFERCRERIEDMLRQMFDGVSSDAPFGARIVFHEIYRQLGAVESVDRIYELSISPGNFRYADMSGMDIVLGSNALYCPGSFRIEFVEAHGNMEKKYSRG